MWLDAILAYLHFTAIFLLFAFLTVQVILIRQPLDMRTVRLLGRMDIWYFSSAIAALITGFLRATVGAKGADFYFNAWPIYVKIGLFLAVGLISVKPTMTFIRLAAHARARRRVASAGGGAGVDAQARHGRSAPRGAHPGIRGDHVAWPRPLTT